MLEGAASAREIHPISALVGHNDRIMRSGERIAAALVRARAIASDPGGAASAGNTSLRPRLRRFAIGDPQAPIEHVLAILDRASLLGDDGWLHPDVALVSMGDHFDWGAATEREQATESGLFLLAWLAAHPSDQVTLLLGNHDLGRVGELAGLSDDDMARAHQLARQAYRDGKTDRQLEEQLLERFPALPTAELAARDFAAFSTAQRGLVTALLQSRRLRVATAREHVLLCHAGVTIDDLAALAPAGEGNAGGRRASDIASSLNRALDEQLARWTGGSLAIPHLHRPGDREFGEGRGIFYHRPSNPDHEKNPALFQGPYRRRYNAQRLVPGIVQVIGHISDRKCRKLLGPWASGDPAPTGALRHLIVRGSADLSSPHEQTDPDIQVTYAAGLPATWPDPVADDRAMMIFTDGGMRGATPDEYQLLDLSTL